MTRYNPSEIADLAACEGDEWFVYLAPNSRKAHIYDEDGDAFCRRYCVIAGSIVMGDPWRLAELPVDDTDGVCAGCRKAATAAQEKGR